MKYYAHFGHKDFILCLGYKAEVIKQYFINYNETVSNDFVFSNGGKTIELLNSDISDWKITFLDTGVQSNIGMRLMKVREQLADEEMFLANYADGLTNLNLNHMIEQFIPRTDKVASFMTYQPTASFHVVQAEQDGNVTSIQPISYSNLWLNTGYFVFRKNIFDYIEYGEELVVEPFQRLIDQQLLMTYHFNGFWQQMDTFRDKMILDELQEKGTPPWQVWNNHD